MAAVVAVSLRRCPEKGRLLDEFEGRVKIYGVCVRAVAKAMPVKFEEYLDMHHQNEQARNDVERARRALRFHCSQHGCCAIPGGYTRIRLISPATVRLYRTKKKKGALPLLNGSPTTRR